MSYKTDYRIEGFFEYVVPPLEGFWWQEGVDGVDYSDKSTFCWISVIRLPDFITKKVPIAEFIMRSTFLMPEKLLRIN